jgi:hypothetical protein
VKYVIAAVLVWGYAERLLILGVPLALVIWVVWLLVNPFTNCGWCKGKGKHPLSSKKTFGSCWNPRCQRGTVQRFGSKRVHRARQALTAYRRNGKN